MIVTLHRQVGTIVGTCLCNVKIPGWQVVMERQRLWQRGEGCENITGGVCSDRGSKLKEVKCVILIMNISGVTNSVPLSYKKMSCVSNKKAKVIRLYHIVPYYHPGRSQHHFAKIF